MWDRFSGNGGSKTASRGLRAVDDLTAAVLATLSDHVAIVDGDGNLIAVNKAWKSYDCECGDRGLPRSDVGSNYLEACEAAEQAGAGGVEGAVLGLRAVIEGSKPHFSLTYICYAGSGRQWFRMTVTPTGSPPDGAVISHAAVGKPSPAGEAPLDSAIASAETGEPLLRALTENVAKTIGARFAFLSEVADQSAGRVRLIALWSGSGFEESFEYEVRGTPCQDVLRGELCVYPADVQESFPDDAWLKEIEAQCYLGLPLYSAAGEVIGHLGVIHDQPLGSPSFAEHVLRAIAAQASPELERMCLLRALQKSERTGRALLNAPGDSAALLEADGTITDLNEVAAIRAGTTVEEAVGRNVFDLFPPEQVATRREALNQVLTSREPLHDEFEEAGKSFESSLYPVLDLQGEVESVAIFAHDVTARKVAEEELRQREDKYHTLVDTITHGVEEIDLSGVITFANEAYHRIFEHEDGELIGASVLDLSPSDHDRAALRDYLALVAKDEPAPVLMTAKKKTKSGRIIDVELAWDYKRSDDGKATGLVAVVTDITARKQAEEALRKSAERNAALLDAIPDMMFSLDRQGVYLDFVPAEGYEPYLPRDKFIGKSVFEILPAALAGDIMRAVASALETGRQQELEYELDRDDQEHEYEARILKSKEDEALAIVRDVTAAKRLEREEQLRKARDELEGSVEKVMLGKNPYGLTFREFTVLHLAADGEADKAIADQLGISTFTVSKHVANILGKMGAASRTEACVRSLREGLLT